MKKVFSNLSIQKKILIGFTVVIVLTIILSVFSISSMRTINSNYTDLQNGINKGSQVSMKIGWEYSRARRSLVAMAYLADDPVAYETARNEFNEKIYNIGQLIDELVVIMREDEKRNGTSIDKELKTMEVLIESITVDYAGFGKQMDDAVKLGRFSELRDIINEGTPIANQINETLDDFINGITIEADSISEQTSQTAERSMFILLAVAIGSVLFSIMCAIFIERIIKKPISDLGEAAKRIAAGDLDTNVRSNAKDEIGELSNLFGDVVDIFSLLVDKINHTYTQLQDGELDVAIDETLFPGGYKKAASAVNNTVDYLAGNTWDAVNCMKEYGDGNFDATIRRFKGSQAILHETIDVLRDNLKSVDDEINKLIENAVVGILDVRIDSNNYRGGWRKIMAGLNKLLEAVDTPISEVSEVLLQVEKANFNVSVSGNYSGKFNEMKEAVNKTVKGTEEYIRDISEILVKMSDQDLDLNISKEYIGDFKIIKDSLNQIIETFNMMFKEFRVSAEQVAAGSSQISESSMTLAQGASHQASSVQELSATIETISQQTSENAKNSDKANKLSMQARNDGIASKQEMEEMLESMAAIEEASIDISRIIKEIEDIAFQTNLLALNAAVEAARAGGHGKGFKVVAEEVRSLADKSRIAASETADLINKTIEIVSEGNKIANSTSASLNNIVEQIAKTAEIIDSVSAASNEQDIAVGQIKEGVDQISSVIQANASVSEESASSAQELSSQAELLKNTLAKVSLKR